MKLMEAREYLSRFYVRAKQSVKRRSRSSGSLETAAVIDASNPPTHCQAALINTGDQAMECPDKVILPKTRKRASRLRLKPSKWKLKQTPISPNPEPIKENSNESTLILQTENSSDIDIKAPSKPASSISTDAHLQDIPHSITKETDKLDAIQAEHLPRLSGETLDDGIASRKASSHTVFSEKSNGTVHRDPSKRCTSPIETIDAIVHDPNPFSDSQELRRILSSSRSVLVPRGSSQEINDCPNPQADCSLSVPHASSHHCTGRRSESTSFEVASRKSSNSSDDTSNRILAGNEVERRERVRSRAVLGFNTSAEYFRLEQITPSYRNLPPALGEQTTDRPASFLNRLRRVKSTFNLKRKDGANPLRRIKTYANVNAQCPLGSLTGKTIEELARLGGESMLNLPPEYGPGALRLPTCIAAPAYYLLQHGTSAPHAHGLSRNEPVVAALYSHYAIQILRAEGVKDTISRTTRSMDLPPEDIFLNGRDKGDSFVQDISTVFRHFLCELPGGILGSAYLYRTLARIYEHDFAAAGKAGDPGRKEYIYNISPSLAAKVRMVAFALLALTTDMQLELICAVFGLLSLTSDECSDRKQAHRYLHDKETGPCDFCLALPSPRSLGRVFGCLLYEPRAVNDPELIVQFFMTENTLAADVTTMLIDLWKGISSQLWKWGVIEGGR